MKKTVLILLLAAALLLTASAAALQADGLPFVIKNGDRDSNMVAITVDDCFDLPLTRVLFEMSREMNVPFTFFPLGCQILEEDADLWRAMADSPCEIGTHTYAHVSMGDQDEFAIYNSIGRSKAQLDLVLGRHYEMRCIRPPYGRYQNAAGSSHAVRTTVQRMGFPHMINWDVDDTNPNTAIRKVRGGSILLYHARPEDVACLRQLIPALQQKGYRLVTLSELLGFEPPVMTDAMYVHNSDDFWQWFLQGGDSL